MPYVLKHSILSHLDRIRGGADFFVPPSTTGSLTHHWKLNETSGDIVYDSVGNVNGALMTLTGVANHPINNPDGAASISWIPTAIDITGGMWNDKSHLKATGGAINVAEVTHVQISRTGLFTTGNPFTIAFSAGFIGDEVPEFREATMISAGLDDANRSKMMIQFQNDYNDLTFFINDSNLNWGWGGSGDWPIVTGVNTAFPRDPVGSTSQNSLQYIALTFTGGGLANNQHAFTTYRNGIVVTTGVGGAIPLGGSFNSGNYFFGTNIAAQCSNNISINDVRIYDTALSSAEILTLATGFTHLWTNATGTGDNSWITPNNWAENVPDIDDAVLFSGLYNDNCDLGSGIIKVHHIKTDSSYSGIIDGRESVLGMNTYTFEQSEPKAILGKGFLSPSLIEATGTGDIIFSTPTYSHTNTDVLAFAGTGGILDVLSLPTTFGTLSVQKSGGTVRITGAILDPRVITCRNINVYNGILDISGVRTINIAEDFLVKDGGILSPSGGNITISVSGLCHIIGSDPANKMDICPYNPWKIVCEGDSVLFRNDSIGSLTVTGTNITGEAVNCEECLPINLGSNESTEITPFDSFGTAGLNTYRLTDNWGFKHEMIDDWGTCWSIDSKYLYYSQLGNNGTASTTIVNAWNVTTDTRIILGSGFNETPSKRWPGIVYYLQQTGAVNENMLVRHDVNIDATSIVKHAINWQALGNVNRDDTLFYGFTTPINQFVPQMYNSGDDTTTPLLDLSGVFQVTPGFHTDTMVCRGSGTLFADVGAGEFTTSDTTQMIWFANTDGTNVQPAVNMHVDKFSHPSSFYGGVGVMVDSGFGRFFGEATGIPQTEIIFNYFANNPQFSGVAGVPGSQFETTNKGGIIAGAHTRHSNVANMATTGSGQTQLYLPIPRAQTFPAQSHDQDPHTSPNGLMVAFMTNYDFEWPSANHTGQYNHVADGSGWEIGSTRVEGFPETGVIILGGQEGIQYSGLQTTFPFAFTGCIRNQITGASGIEDDGGNNNDIDQVSVGVEGGIPNINWSRNIIVYDTGRYLLTPDELADRALSGVIHNFVTNQVYPAELGDGDGLPFHGPSAISGMRHDQIYIITIPAIF